MAIELDAEIGSSTANSYIDVARADELMPILVSSSRNQFWQRVSVTDKPILLMRAVRLLEQFMEWEGTKVSDYQPIGWPRDWVYGPDRDVVLPTNEIPQPVEEAQALLALNLAEGFDQTESSAAPVDYVKVASISVSFSAERAARGSTLLPGEVIEKLRGYGDYIGASGMARPVELVRS